MSIEEFTGFCKAEGLESDSVPVLLNYFHNTGLFYYKKGLFGNNIVLDQQWAINAVYRIFNRKDFFTEDHPNGKFTGADLNKKWSIEDGEEQYSIDGQELFVSFMKQCEICFELTDEYKTDYFERTFIAPQLLPADKPNSLAHQNLFKEGSIYLKYKHQFLHAAVIQRFIVRCGSLSDETDMWQQGLLIKWEGNLAMIEAFPDTNEILVHTENAANKKLLEKIRNEIKEITKDESGIQEFASFDGNAYVSLEKLRTLPAGNKSIEAVNGEWVEASIYLPLLHVDEKNVFEKDKEKGGKDQNIEGANNKPEIFFSYAWGVARERIVDELYDSLKNDEEYTLVRDKKDLGYRDLISDFMKKIGTGDFIIVVISDKYLRSEFCMFELYEILRNSKLETTELKKKIFPIYVENIALNKPSVQKEYIKYWQGAENEWEDIKRISKNFSNKQNQQLIKIKKLNAELGDLLMMLSDMNMLTKELLSANNFEKIKKAIKEKV